jgi:hypothetical protein
LRFVFFAEVKGDEVDGGGAPEGVVLRGRLWMARSGGGTVGGVEMGETTGRECFGVGRT